MGYDTDRVGMYRPVGAYTGQILKGVKPADLPVLQTTTARFVPGGEAGDNPSVASLQVQSFLALEIPK